VVFVCGVHVVSVLDVCVCVSVGFVCVLCVCVFFVSINYTGCIFRAFCTKLFDFEEIDSLMRLPVKIFAHTSTNIHSFD